MAMPGPAAVGAAELWAQYNRDKLSWAFRAYTHFIESLSPEIRERLAHKDRQAEPYVVVFGKTQVGKTTLLLDLMGVLPAQMVRVSRVLRGKQPKGQSATATTMEYRRSADQRWGLKVNDAGTVWFSSDADMEAALAGLRQQMETRRLAALAPSVVFLPLDCFASQSEQPAVRMLDLPGDKPANPTEQEHVSAMARKYVPLADLILLVGKGDDLSFLQEGALTLPGIEDWQSAPRRFRIITTYSFASQSVRELARDKGATADIELYRERLVQQIERSIPLSKDARQAGNFFPLEFGQSWLDTEKQEPVLYQRVTPLIDSLKQQLLAEIHASTTPLARLRAAVDAHIVIARVKEKRLSVMDALTTALRSQLKQAQGELAHAQTAARQAAKACLRQQQQLSILTPERLQHDLENHFRLPDKSDFGDPDEKVTGFRVCIQTARSFLMQGVLNSCPAGTTLGESAAFWRSLDIVADKKRIGAILDVAYRDFTATLDGYWINAYVDTSDDSNYTRDKAMLKKCTAVAHRALTDLAKRWWLEAAQNQVALLESELASDRTRERSWQQFADEGRTAVETLERKLQLHEQARQTFNERMDADLQESRRFVDLLDSEYLAELRQRRLHIETEGCAVSAFIGLMAAIQLEQVRQQVLLHVDETAG
jgi:hypothetical protein